jgi:hypothetical protein
MYPHDRGLRGQIEVGRTNGNRITEAGIKGIQSQVKKYCSHQRLQEVRIDFIL